MILILLQKNFLRLAVSRNGNLKVSIVFPGVGRTLRQCNKSCEPVHSSHSKTTNQERKAKRRTTSSRYRISILDEYAMLRTRFLELVFIFLVYKDELKFACSVLLDNLMDSR